MRKGRKEKIEQEVEVIEMICCNKCGQEFKNKKWVGRVHEFYIDFANYYSKFDNEKWKFDLCEDCIFDIAKSFKIIPDGFYQPYVEPQEISKTSREEMADLDMVDIENIQILNSFSVGDSKRNTDGEIEFVLIEQTNDFCLFLEKVKPLEWENYLMENGDGEFVNIAPLAWELGAVVFTSGKKFQ